jgi:hypothetical protein
MKKVFVFLALFLCVGGVQAQVIDVPKECRVENFGDGFCAWCSIECLGRVHKVELLYNLAKNRSKESDFKVWHEDVKNWTYEPYVWVPRSNDYFVKEQVNGGGEWAVYSKLKSLDVRAKVQWRGNKNTDLISYAMKNKLGCVFAIEGIDPIKGEAWAHAMVLIECNDKEVMFIDPNDIEHIKTRTRAWFNQNWNGYLIVIESPKKQP